MTDAPWLNIIYQCIPDQVSDLELTLVEHDACSISFTDTFDEPMFEPELGTMPLWPATTVTALFKMPGDISELVRAIERTHLTRAGFGLPQCKIEALEDQQWERVWLEHFKPMQMGNRLWICPTWCAPPDDNAINLMLDPGLAFGTGTHPTTCLCLRWLDAQEQQAKNIVDFGCGSGILAIASALLGAQNILAIDHDPQAILATQTNAEQNQVSEKIQAVLPGASCTQKAELVLANILVQPLIDLKQVLLSYLSEQGTIVLSGILAEQESLIRSHYESQIRFTERSELDGWILLSGQLIKE